MDRGLAASLVEQTVETVYRRRTSGFTHGVTKASRSVSERVGPEPSIYVKLTPEQDARNAMLAHEVLTRPLRERTKQLAKDREDYCRKLFEHRLPRRLHWLINHPRLLKRVLRVVKRWEPMLSLINLRRVTGLPDGASRASALAAGNRWLEQSTGNPELLPGMVLEYTDQDGLPAEVYGPVA